MIQRERAVQREIIENELIPPVPPLSCRYLSLSSRKPFSLSPVPVSHLPLSPSPPSLPSGLTLSPSLSLSCSLSLRLSLLSLPRGGERDAGERDLWLQGERRDRGIERESARRSEDLRGLEREREREIRIR